jgi:glucose-6-phosphate-specific signal transduction histidine kinase
MIRGVHGAFSTVLWVVCITASVVALAALISTRKTWRDYGKDGLLMDSELARSPSGGTPAADHERDEEIRQMIEARNARRRRRGEKLLDIDEEIARLTPPTVDPQLHSEIRELVVARNYRRTRAGKPPLDVEAEVQRELEKVQELQSQVQQQTRPPRSG